MAWVWAGLVLVAAALVTVIVKRAFGQRYIERRIAGPLAQIERSCEDALAELAEGRALFAPTAGEDAAAGLSPLRLGGKTHPAASGEPPRPPVYVGPFAPELERLARLPRAAVASLGPQAVAQHQQLVHAIRVWNAAAGKRGDPKTLLPTMLTAHTAARALASHIEAETLNSARRQAQTQLLYGLVAVPHDGSSWVH